MLLSPGARGYLSAVSLDNSGLICVVKYIMTGGLVMWPGNCSFSLPCAKILAESLKNLTSYIFSVGLWQTSLTQIPSSALYCHLFAAAARPGMELCICSRVMKWIHSASLHCFQNISFRKLSSTLFIFFSTPFSGYIFGLCVRYCRGLRRHSNDMAPVASASLLESLFVILTGWKRLLNQQQIQAVKLVCLVSLKHHPAEAIWMTSPFFSFFPF